MILSLILAAAAFLPTVPGATNPAVTQADIAQTVCVHGWTKTIRPPASYTNKLKLKQMAALGLTGSPHDYEEDHDISLEIGGNPTDPNNLWPEPWHGPWNAHDKDKLENALKRDVCTDKMTLSAAQAAIRTNWTAEYQRRWGVAKDAAQTVPPTPHGERG
jgi:hypothetical protein